MPPTIVAVGAVTSSLSAITPAFPAGVAAGHVLVTVAECEGVTTPGAYTLPTGWAHITGSPILQSTNTRLWVIWRLYDGVFTAPSLGDSGDHNIGRMLAIADCPTTGTPWDVAAVATEAVSDTTAVFPGVTTTTPDTLVLEIISTGTDTTTGQMSTITNANYSSITSQMNNWTTSGNGGGFAVVSGVKATAGATGQSTGTVTTAATKAMMTVAFKLGSAGAPQILQRNPRPSEQFFMRGAYASVNPSTIVSGG